MTDLEGLWLEALQDVMSRAAHEVKDSLNGVSLNLEVIRSRSSRAGVGDIGSLAAFSTAAVEQMELLTLRTEAVLYLSRPPRGSADVALALRHLACLLIPATAADGGRLLVEGYQQPAPTSALPHAIRLALAAGLLALTRNGGSGRCWLETGANPVVRFSHESADACTLDASVASALADHSIRTERAGSELVLNFPGP